MALGSYPSRLVAQLGECAAQHLQPEVGAREEDALRMEVPACL